MIRIESILNIKHAKTNEINRKTNNDCENRLNYYYINNKVYLI